MNDELVYLYFWDKKQNKLCVSEKEVLCMHPLWRSPYAAVKGCARYQVSSTEGKVYQNKLWLYKRDDQRAKEAFVEYYTKKKNYLNNQVIKLWRQIEDIKSLSVTAYESHT